MQVNEITVVEHKAKKIIVCTTFKGKSGYNIINYIKMLSSEIFVSLSNSASRVA